MKSQLISASKAVQATFMLSGGLRRIDGGIQDKKQLICFKTGCFVHRYDSPRILRFHSKSDRTFANNHRIGLPHYWYFFNKRLNTTIPTTI
ncbi:hypothetical protein [Pseudoramibacter faecis]|uniref:hypothetical protein n=1 Tax=Pseudoramibacter faecis TaxID=3108534 RepID=UPI002E761FD6|nr:hypothetical protein [Pseudoramibacter sp. HA2172]